MGGNNDVLVSIIIPSAGRRPELLKRSIESALMDDQEIKAEIIVVLNGKDGMAFNLEYAFRHPLVTYYKIEEGNVSKARNFGLLVAKGDLIRFLDDDDYLLRTAAIEQYQRHYQGKYDISTFAISIGTDDMIYQTILPPKLQDYVAASISEQCPSLVLSNVYRKELIQSLFWDESINITEDENWMRSIARHTEVKWLTSDLVIGIWYQHDIDRLSFALPHPDYYLNRNISIIETIEALKASQRLSKERLDCAAKGIWSSVHHSFYFAPIYWTKMGLYARKLDPTSKPQENFFDKLPDFIHPLVIEWLMLPKRWLTHQIRKLKNKLGLLSYIRKI